MQLKNNLFKVNFFILFLRSYYHNLDSITEENNSSGISSCCTSSSSAIIDTNSLLNKKQQNSIKKDRRDLSAPTHRAQFSFIPRHNDELHIEVGDALRIERQSDDHWCYG